MPRNTIKFVNEENPESEPLKDILQRAIAKSANTEEEGRDSSNSAQFSAESTTDILTRIAEEKNTDLETATLCTCAILNQGGSAARAQDSIYYKIGKTKIDLATVKLAIKKTEGNRATTRKLARTLGTDLYTICKGLGVRGNLANRILQLDSSLTEDDLIWAADFQSQNPDCPERVRRLLKRHYDEAVLNSKQQGSKK